MKDRLIKVYRTLYAHFGPQEWWPARTSFEVMVGAILTQNTNWLNVEKAIANLKDAKALTPGGLNKLTRRRIAALIRPAGYYNIKSERLKNFLDFFAKGYSSSARRMSLVDTGLLRRELLAVKGIGPETADSILLYALNKPVFVVDAYTKRIFSRHGFFSEDSGYDEVQKIFMQNLKDNVRLFNEYHALIVELAKNYCRKNDSKCGICPLKNDL